MARSGYKITVHDWGDVPAAIDKLWEASDKAFDREFVIAFYEKYLMEVPRIFTYNGMDSTVISFNVNHDFINTYFLHFIELSLVNYEYDNGTFKI